MSNIELVIKMPEIEYEYITNREKFHSLEKNKQEWLINKTLNYLLNGIQLPKEHGDLIDRKKLQNNIDDKDLISLKDISKIQTLRDWINNQNPIIKADKADVDEINDTHLSTFEVAGIVAIKNGIPLSKGIDAGKQ